MRERPILFNGEMVRAILDGTKTQTRRPVKVSPRMLHVRQHSDKGWCFADADVWNEPQHVALSESAPGLRCPFGEPRDRLWVREAFNVGRPLRNAEGIVDDELAYTGPLTVDPRGSRFMDDWCVGYAADGCEGRMRPSIHMPRWASRITLEILGTRVERVQSISEADAQAEGCNGDCGIGNLRAYLAGPHRYHFASIWEQTYGADAWNDNPWVWAIEFKRTESKT